MCSIQEARNEIYSILGMYLILYFFSYWENLWIKQLTLVWIFGRHFVLDYSALFGVICSRPIFYFICRSIFMLNTICSKYILNSFYKEFLFYHKNVIKYGKTMQCGQWPPLWQAFAVLLISLAEYLDFDLVHSFAFFVLCLFASLLYV